MKKLQKETLKAIKGGLFCGTICRNELNVCKARTAGTPAIELCWDQFFICVESC